MTGRKELELRFFATYREAVGQKEITREFDADATVGDVLEGIEAEFSGLAGELLEEGGDIQPQLTVLRNGREVVHLSGTETTMEDGDRIEGDDWTADLSAETVQVAGSIELTEVTVSFEGPQAVLEELVEDFTRKAMRAGG